MRRFATTLLAVIAVHLALALPAWGQSPTADPERRSEITPESERALKLGLEWLHREQGAEGNWGSNDLGLVGMGALAFMADGHSPGRGKYGRTLEKALDYMIKQQKPSGLFNMSHPQRDMYNHGLATFVMGQAHGMSPDVRINSSLDRALKLITATQCQDGGWDYQARRQTNGHDLSLAVMQAKALRSAVDSGLEVPPEVIDLAIKSVREHYCPKNGRRDEPEAVQKEQPGQFTYGKGGGGGSLAMAAAGVVCLQEFGQYDDWRIEKNLEFIEPQLRQVRGKAGRRSGRLPYDAYTLYYVGQAMYQVGGEPWKENYPGLRDYLVQSQAWDDQQEPNYGYWDASGHVGGKPGQLYGTAVGCFILAIPNRYLPILQEGKIEAFKKRYERN